MSLKLEDALLRHLLEAERSDRGLRSIRYQMHAACFPVHRDLAGFDYTQTKLDRRQIELFASTTRRLPVHSTPAEGPPFGVHHWSVLNVQSWSVLGAQQQVLTSLPKSTSNHASSRDESPPSY